MTDNTQTTIATEGTIKTVLSLNKQCDLGALVMEDCQSYSDKTETEILELSKKNFQNLFKELFDLKRQQRAKLGEDGGILEYTKAQFAVDLPEPRIIVPRQKPVPKEKPKTKWEKFRDEKGLPARQKRSRLVFDPITKDWVPRWGPNSHKKIEAKHEWLLEDNIHHEAAGVDPFTMKRQEKKMEQEKEKMRKLKNDLHSLKTMHGSKSIKNVTEILNNKKDAVAAKTGRNNGVSEDEIRKQATKKRERKALDKSFKLAQLSTASMGKFDKKISKSEPDAPSSQKILKKKSNQQLANLERDPKQERERNLKILNWMGRAEEVKANNSKADAHFNADKMANKQQRKIEKSRKKQKNE